MQHQAQEDPQTEKKLDCVGTSEAEEQCGGEFPGFSYCLP